MQYDQLLVALHLCNPRRHETGTRITEPRVLVVVEQFPGKQLAPT